MADQKFPTVYDSAARSVAAPQLGWSDDTITTATSYVDLSAWKGKYVRVTLENTDAWLCFVNDATEEMTISSTDAPVTPAPGDPAPHADSLGVAQRFFRGVKEDIVVPDGNGPKVLCYRAVSSGSARRISIHRS